MTSQSLIWNSVRGMPDSLRENWVRVFRSDSLATAFQSWAWQKSASTHLARRVEIWEASHEGNVVAYVPLVRTGYGGRTYRFLGSGPTDYLQPIVCDHARVDVFAALQQRISQQAFFDWMDCRDDLGVTFPYPQKVATKRSVCLQLDLPETFEAYVQGLGKSLRYDVRKALRDPALTVRFATPETIANDLDTFFALHHQRWTKRGLPGAFFAKTKRFHHAFAPSALKEGLLWLTLLDHTPPSGSTKTIGAVYALQHGRRVHFYQSGFDPEAKALSPGTALVAAIIRRAIEEGKTTFDFLRGDEPYKRRWKPQRTVHGDRWVHHDGSLLGRVAYQSVKMASSAEQRLKDRFEGKGLH